MNNSNSSNSGCLVATIIIVAVFVIGGVVVATAFYRFKATNTEMERSEEIQMAHEAHGTSLRIDPRQGREGPLVILERTTISDYSPTQLGETLDAKHYVAIACAPNLTSLAEQKFIEAAEGMPIDWRVRIEDIKQDPSEEGQISGQFSMPYEIREDHSAFGSSISISATFPAEKSNELISLRSGESIQIRGDLKILNNSTNSVRLLNPEIVIEGH